MDILRIGGLTRKKIGYNFYVQADSNPYREYNAKARLINPCIKYFPEVNIKSAWSLKSSKGSNIEMIKSKERGGNSAQNYTVVESSCKLLLLFYLFQPPEHSSCNRFTISHLRLKVQKSRRKQVTAKLESQR